MQRTDGKGNENREEWSREDAEKSKKNHGVPIGVCSGDVGSGKREADSAGRDLCAGDHCGNAVPACFAEYGDDSFGPEQRSTK